MLAGSVQQDGPVRLRDERPRSRTLTGSRPVPSYRGQYLSDGGNSGAEAAASAMTAAALLDLVPQRETAFQFTTDQPKISSSF